MTETQKWYKLNSKTPLIPEMELVKRQWPYYAHVGLITLKSGDNLHRHRRHSKNTHYIIAGSTKIKKMGRNLRFIEEEKIVGQWIPMEKDTWYQASSGPDGCTFIEGHQLLSPATAQRSVGNGTVVELDGYENGAITVDTLDWPEEAQKTGSIETGEN